MDTLILNADPHTHREVVCAIVPFSGPDNLPRSTLRRENIFPTCWRHPRPLHLFPSTLWCLEKFGGNLDISYAAPTSFCQMRAFNVIRSTIPLTVSSAPTGIWITNRCLQLRNEGIQARKKSAPSGPSYVKATFGTCTCRPAANLFPKRLYAATASNTPPSIETLRTALLQQ